MRRLSNWLCCVALLCAGFITGSAFADGNTLTGSVALDGQPAPGAQVAALHKDSGISFTSFADSAGKFSIAVEFPGTYSVSARRGRTSTVSDVAVTNASTATIALTLSPDPEFITRVTSEQWMSLLPDSEQKREFLLNCASCHEIGSARVLIEGKARTTAQWSEAFAKMRAIDQYNILPGDFDDQAYVEWLTTHLTDEAAATLSPAVPRQADKLARVRITEFPLPNATELPHDLVVGPHGRIWITAFFTDLMWALDPASGEIETYALRADGADGWGQARALVFDANGILWVVLGGTHELVALDPKTRAFKTYGIGMYAHSLVIDGEGRIWFNDYFAVRERIGVFDPRTETVEHIEIPSAGMTPAQGLPLPYGLQIDSNGRLYSTQMAANTVVMFDTATRESTLMTMPVSNTAPRRPAIGLDQRLWIPEWSNGHLAAYDPNTKQFNRYAVGTSALGAYDAEVDPRSGEIWVTGALGASMVVFNPADEQTLEIPLPTNPAYTRHLAVDPRNGDLWSAYSSLPAATPKVVRIERH